MGKEPNIRVIVKVPEPFRDQAYEAARNAGYTTLQEYLRAKMQELINAEAAAAV